jgi:hypothetical protein
MIRYALSCAGQHRFEAWFTGSEAFERQRSDGAIACPLCGSTTIEKALMAPAVSSSRRKETVRAAVKEAAVRVAANVPEHSEMTEMLRKLRKDVTENAEYVGEKFPEEARRIHYNETEKRGIYGEASPDEARSLADEGIEFHPLPVLPEDHN